MRVYWWQAGLHFEPETDRDYRVLRFVLSAALRLFRCGRTPTASVGPSAGPRNQVGELGRRESSATPPILTGDLARVMNVYRAKQDESA